MRAIAFVAALFACLEAFGADAARDAATIFYRSYAKLRANDAMTGIPGRKQMARLSPMLTAELRGLLAAARREQERCRKKFPNEKPPWIEGDVFSSNFEGFTSFRVDASRPRGRGQGRTATVRFLYSDGKARVDWTDELVLRNEAGRWRVADVVYRARFAFTSGFGTHLTDALKRIPAC